MLAAAGRDALERAYLATRYVVFARGPPIVLRVGLPNRELDRVLQRYGHRDWAFITACNPRSRLLPRWRNRQRQRRLARLFPAALLGAGLGEGLGWAAEESLLVPGMPAGRARRIGRLFDQNAVVAGRRGGPARLIWCSGRTKGRGLIS